MACAKQCRTRKWGRPLGVCVCVSMLTRLRSKLRPLAVTPVLITLQPEQPQALLPLLLLQPSSFASLVSPSLGLAPLILSVALHPSRSVYYLCSSLSHLWMVSTCTFTISAGVHALLYALKHHKVASWCFWVSAVSLSLFLWQTQQKRWACSSCRL